MDDLRVAPQSGSGGRHVECASAVTRLPLAMGVRFSLPPQSQCSAKYLVVRTGAEYLGCPGRRERRVAPGDRRIIFVRRVARFGEASRLAATTVPKTVCLDGRVGSTPTLSTGTAGRTSTNKGLRPICPWPSGSGTGLQNRLRKFDSSRVCDALRRGSSWR